MYTEYQPSHLLAPYIDNYWEFKGNPEYGMRLSLIHISEFAWYLIYKTIDNCNTAISIKGDSEELRPVSYTHLDVYKRQVFRSGSMS